MRNEEINKLTWDWLKDARVRMLSLNLERALCFVNDLVSGIILLVGALPAKVGIILMIKLCMTGWKNFQNLWLVTSLGKYTA